MTDAQGSWNERLLDKQKGTPNLGAPFA